MTERAAGDGVRVRSALLRLDGTFEPPHLDVDGEVDLTTIGDFTAALSSVLDNSSGDVWVDVERLEFIDVGGLRVLAGAAGRLGLQDRRLVLRSVAPHLARLMDLVGWSQIPGLLMLRSEDGRPRTGCGHVRSDDRQAPRAPRSRASLRHRRPQESPVAAVSVRDSLGARAGS
ncbi:Anti-anti-sigma regulatory factor (antagonist of anti-sigma factor) [Mycobacterium tuberculosis]|nr:Anti-anti-sigma regulatory factor (antagonist of anti-sigma factor) [Mycobacterium tuberculosis]